MKHQNLPGRVGAWCVRHPVITVACWLAAIAFGLIGFQVANHGFTPTVTVLAEPESKRGSALIHSGMGDPNSVTSRVLCGAGQNGPVPIASGAQAGADPTSGGLANVAQCYERKWGRAPDPGMQSGAFSGPQSTAEAPQETDPQLSMVKLLLPGDLAAAASGSAASDDRLREILKSDLARAETIGLPLTLLILVLVIGPSLRSLIPLLVGIGAIVVAVGIASLLAQPLSLSIYTVNMIAMLGLATGVDYTLLVYERYRDERRERTTNRRPIETAIATAGWAVLVSGITVILALASLTLMPVNVVRDLALGAVLVVTIGVAAVLTGLPAMLGLLGDRLEARRLTAVLQRAPSVTIWRRWSRIITNRPIVTTLVGLLLLAGIATQALRLETELSPIGTESSAQPVGSTTSAFWEREANTTLRSLLEIAITNPDSADVDRLIMAIGQEHDFAPLVSTQTSGDGTLTVIRAIVVRPSTSAAAEGAVDRLRDTLIPAAIESNASEVLVTGPLAQIWDITHLFATWELRIGILVLAMSFLALGVIFRSVVAPLVATLLTLLSVMAALGVLVLVVQEGHGTWLARMVSTGPIEIWVPIALFSILFGLSMDYHVFLLSRITERYRETGNPTQSIASGLSSTGRVVAAGALIMAVVFASFSTGRLVLLQQLGLGLAVAVTIDAFLVRLTLVPAIMTILGRWNWWAPAWMAKRDRVPAPQPEPSSPVVTLPHEV